jgi:hypothetical protein
MIYNEYALGTVLLAILYGPCLDKVRKSFGKGLFDRINEGG